MEPLAPEYLLEEGHHWRQTMQVYSLTPLLVYTLGLCVCEHKCVQPASSSGHLGPCLPHNYGLFLWIQKPPPAPPRPAQKEKSSFYKLLLVMLFYLSKEKK